MKTILGRITHVDPLDNGQRLGVTLDTGAGRPLYLVAEASSAAAGMVKNAASSRLEIEADVAPVELRLGAPSGRIAAIRPAAANDCALARAA